MFNGLHLMQSSRNVHFTWRKFVTRNIYRIDKDGYVLPAGTLVARVANGPYRIDGHDYALVVPMGGAYWVAHSDSDRGD